MFFVNWYIENILFFECTPAADDVKPAYHYEDSLIPHLITSASII